MKTNLILFSLLFLVSCSFKVVSNEAELEAAQKEIAFLNVDKIVLEAELAQLKEDNEQSNNTLQVALNGLTPCIKADKLEEGKQ
jgi:Skp family chaperone for outer membrane proteins